MPTIRLRTFVNAPAAAAFDASRSIRLHLASMAAYGEELVGSTADDLLGPSDEVTWRARHLGLTFELTVRIVEFDPPRHFRDAMVHGPFASMHHDHRFRERGGVTEVEDEFSYALPLGPLGRLADVLVVRRRLRRLLERRHRAIEDAAASG